MPQVTITREIAPPPAPRDQYWSIAASTVMHLVAIGALSLVFWQPERSAPAEVVQNVPSPELPAPVDAPSPAIMELPDPAAAPGGGRAGPIRPMQLPKARLNLPGLGSGPSSPIAYTGPIDLLEGVPVRELAGGGSGTGLGSGTGSGVGPGAGTTFFPAKKPTGNYIFVVDCSRSMNHPYQGGAKTRLGRVKIEMWRSIFQMAGDQKFFIIFFNDRAIPMPAETLMPGGPSNDKFLQWTAQIRADGRTEPGEALLLAVRMKPDVIYFLTDGEFNYRVVREVSEANFGNVEIDTISLGDDTGREFLAELARRNNGVYRHIVEAEDQY